MRREHEALAFSALLAQDAAVVQAAVARDVRVARGRADGGAVVVGVVGAVAVVVIVRLPRVGLVRAVGVVVVELLAEEVDVVLAVLAPAVVALAVADEVLRHDVAVAVRHVVALLRVAREEQALAPMYVARLERRARVVLAVAVEVGEGDAFQFRGNEVRVMDVSGHTVGHIAFFMPGAGAAFTADSLMALGCGRVFEGTPEMMWNSLSKLAALPEDTVIYSGHEYTLSNGKFALTIEPDNTALKERVAGVEAARSEGRFTVPSTLAEEKATNPFLRAGEASVAAALGMEGKSAAEVFSEIRIRKDNA